MMSQLFSKKLLGVICFTFSAYIAGIAVPAYPGIIETTQPDGTKIRIVLQGDEHNNWAVTPDGYTLLRNSDNYWTIAQQDYNGWLTPSDILYRNNSEIAAERNISKGLRFHKEQLAANKQKRIAAGTKASSRNELQVEGTFPTKGKNKLLLLLLNFSDTDTTYSQKDFDRMMNEENYSSIGSFRDYYLENSYGLLDITTVVTRWVTLPYEKSYYGSERAIEMIQNGLNILDDEIDLADFDNDGDGILDGLAVIHQGTGQEYSGASNEIWSHSSIIYGMSFDGIQVRRYTIEPELLNNSGAMSTIGVICHEFGHNLGAPDFYDSDYQASNGYYPGTGTWDLMASGAWNGNNGDRPAGINMWQKIQCGWVTPTLLEQSGDITGMSAAHNTPVAYRFDTTVPGEYFILENRQQAGNFDVALPGHGMLIYHANDAMIKATVDANTLNVKYPQAMYLVCAGAGIDPNSSPISYGNLAATNTPFPGSDGITTFSDSTLPSSRSISGRNSYKALSNIQESNEGVISFRFTNEGAPASPINLRANTEKGVVTLSWQMPENCGDIAYFNIYRDNINIGQTTQYSYTDNNITDQSYITYQVDATYNNGLTSPYTSVSTRIPENFVTEIHSSVSDNSVTLTWDIDANLTRMTNIDAQHHLIDYNVSSLDYVHRFRIEDLQLYKGYKIRKIAYLPYQAQKDMTLTLRVWEADADGSNPKIVSERVVKEYGTAIWNTTLLTKSVEITGEKELWIGLHCESSTGTVRLLTDVGPVIESYGNWIKLEGGDWKADNTLPGNFFLYAPLVVPEAGEPCEINESGVLTNPYLDMLYPTGYAVYRDNQLMTWCSSRKYVDEAPLSGLHTYSIASLYRGSNESETLSLDVVFGDNAIERNDVTRHKVVVRDQMVSLPSYNGTLTICDMMGRMRYNATYNAGERIKLNSGIFILKTDTEIVKLIVK